MSCLVISQYLDGCIQQGFFFNTPLPDSIIDGIVLRSNTYALARTKLEQFELVEGVMKKNPRYMHPSKYWDIDRQDISTFLLVTTTWATVGYQQGEIIGYNVKTTSVYRPIGWMVTTLVTSLNMYGATSH